jgi:hypothetical protein
VAELSLPERLVHAAEAAIQGAGDTYESPLGDKVDGYSVDFARVAGAAVVDVLAELIGATMYHTCSTIDCARCAEANHWTGPLRSLAQLVRDVPALEEV